MFPFYNQQPLPYYPTGINQNQYMLMTQQGFQVNPVYNTMMQVPQPFYMNYAPYPDLLKPVSNVTQSSQISQNSPEMRKYFSCNCVNTDCRKQYCICFKNGETCGTKCGCSNCRNKQQQQRNLAYEKKKTLSCNCKKSECAKKYCECYANGIKCGESCHCMQCKNC